MILHAHERAVVGKIVSVQGEPISATVLLDGLSRETNLDDPLQTISDARGRYRFDNVPNGPCQLTVVAPGFATRVVHMTKASMLSVRLDVVLDRGESIRGRVLDENGEPAAGWRIQINPRANGDLDDLLERMVAGEFSSAEDGTFTICGLTEGAYSLVLIGHEDDLDATGGPRMIHSDEVTASAGDDDIVLRVRRSGELHGTIEFEGEDPPEYFTVSGAGAPQKFRGDSGKFILRASVIGKIPLEIKAEGFAPAYFEARIPEHGHGELAVTLHACGRLRGRVVHQNGGPVSGAIVSVLPARTSCPRSWFASPATWSSKDGRFLLDHIPSGEVILAVHSPGLAYTHAGPFEAYPGRDLPLVELVLGKGASVSGTVRFGEEPIGDAMVQLESRTLDRRFVDAFWIRAGTRSDALGAFSVADVKPGAYALRVTAAFGVNGRMATRTIPLEVSTGGIAKLDIDLGGGEQSLAIELPDLDGEAWSANLVSGLVEAESTSEPPLEHPHRAYSRSTRDGPRVVFDRLPAGEYTLEIVGSDETRRAYERGEAPRVLCRRFVEIAPNGAQMILDLRDHPMTNTP